VSDDLGPSAERAAIYVEVAVEAESSPATTFTDDAVYAATTRLVEVLTARLLAAAHIREARPKRQLWSPRRS
jgi:hypothetical protein